MLVQALVELTAVRGHRHKHASKSRLAAGLDVWQGRWVCWVKLAVMEHNVVLLAPQELFHR